MLDIIKRQIKLGLSEEEKVNQVREFLQIVILKIIYDLGLFKNIVFTGGTALRIIYGLRRYSEDLDFSLVNKKGYSFAHLGTGLKKELVDHYGFEVDFKSKGEKIVHSIDLRFNNLLFDLGLSSHKSEKLYVKIEIDSNPPVGGKTGLSLVNRDFVFTVTHFDLPSLFATKLHACFFRKYTKGRDIYDLIWYLGKKTMPNFELLNNAVLQTTHKELGITQENLRDFLRDHIKKIDFSVAKKDVERFLVDKKELDLFKKDILLATIESKF